MLFPFLLALSIVSSAVFFNTLNESTDKYMSYLQKQREMLLKNETKVKRAIDLYVQTYDMLPSSHLDLISVGYLTIADTTLSNTNPKIQNLMLKYLKELNKFVSDKTKSVTEIKALFSATDYSVLPQDIKDEISEIEYDIIKSIKSDFKIIDGAIIYTDSFKTTTTYDRIQSARSTKSLSSTNNILQINYANTNNKAIQTEKKYKHSIITKESDAYILIIEAELTAQGYSSEEIESLKKINITKRDDLNITF